MKLPVYLRSGVYYIHTRLNDGKQVKISLRTRDKDTAMLRAIALYPTLMMNRKAPSLDDLLAGFQSGTFNKLEVERITFPSGAQLQGVKVDPNNPHDVQSLLNLVNSLSLPVNAPTSDFTPPDVPKPTQADKNGSTSLKLLELLDKYKLLNKTRSSATLKSYQTHIEEFSRFVKNRQVHLIGKGDITLFLEHLAKSKNTPRTIENKIATVRALFNFAVKHGYYFDSNPASGRQLVSKTDKIKSGYEIYELDEIKALFKLEELRKYNRHMHGIGCSVEFTIGEFIHSSQWLIC